MTKHNKKAYHKVMELLTISKAAKKLGVHPNSLRNWEKRGLIKPVRLPGGQRR
ncbi:MAG: MerR family DNA-binding transcriptional regulator [Moorella sp. (in: firmicutes)]